MNKQYYPNSIWPVECGTNSRKKLITSDSLNITKNEKLKSISRHSGGWATMFIQRGCNELYLQCGAGLKEGEFPPVKRDHAPNTGWLERVDPITLETIERSPDLKSGGHLWCGGAVAHSNGDLYMVNGRYMHRLSYSNKLAVVAEQELPNDHPYNSVLILSDGNLITKTLGHEPKQPSNFCILNSDNLEIICNLTLNTSAMGRFSIDDEHNHIYFTTETEVKRLKYEPNAIDNKLLYVDTSWEGMKYRDENDGATAAWDTCIHNNQIWMMDSGRPPVWPGFKPPPSLPQKAFRVNMKNPNTNNDIIDVIGGEIFGWNPGPPLYDSHRNILVHYDTMSATVVATKWSNLEEDSIGKPRYEIIWKKRYRNTVQMMLYRSGELVLEDSREALGPIGGNSVGKVGGTGEICVVKIETGEELGRAPMNDSATMGMFLCPGFHRDFYVGSIPGTITRVFVVDDDDHNESKL